MMPAPIVWYGSRDDGATVQSALSSADTAKIETLLADIQRRLALQEAIDHTQYVTHKQLEKVYKSKKSLFYF